MAYAAIAGLPPGFSDLLGVDRYFASDEDAVAHLEGGRGPAAGA